jgi:hypothetical protein
MAGAITLWARPGPRIRGGRPLPFLMVIANQDFYYREDPIRGPRW